MKTIKPFIDLGFHTVPLQGQLKRLEDGAKTTPIFTKGWRTHFQENFNEEATLLGGAITGSISGIIAIDCDNDHTTDIFTALDPTHAFSFISRGKGKRGTTLIYKYTPELATTFQINNDELALDFYSDNGFIYLPTDKNETKEKWLQNSLEEMPSIPEIPPTSLALLKQLLVSTHKPMHDTENRPMPVVSANYLAPQVTQFLTKKAFIPGLFRIITPKDFRELEQYAKHGYLHPDNVPLGRGSEYLSKISAILGRDSSIDQDMYTQTIYAINDLWADPMPRKRLDDTIMNPIISGTASINGEPIWRYDQHWHTHGLVIS
ncbi:MAG: bifunctional DNA primase/polymerase, partial [Dehalococcoidales bacterium]